MGGLGDSHLHRSRAPLRVGIGELVGAAVGFAVVGEDEGEVVGEVVGDATTETKRL